MEKPEFYNGELPAGFRHDFDTFLFNTERHRALQGGNWQSYHLLRRDTKKALASVHFSLAAGVAQSPLRAPFGSFQFSKHLQVEALYDFIRQVEVSLKKLGVRTIIVKNPPGGYDANDAVILEVLLLNHGYQVENAEIGATLEVDHDKFADKVDAWEGRKLRQCGKSGMTFKVLPGSLLSDVYEFIRYCRMERKQQLSMTRAELEKTFGQFPDDFFLFGVYSDDTLAAASVSVRINRAIFYNFYSAHPRQFDQVSPVVFLMEGIYNWCAREKIKILDFGTSALEGKPNFGLLDFKIRLGGQPCRKLTFTKEL